MAASTNALDLEPREKLERFCFIGNFNPSFYKRRVSLDVRRFHDQLEKIVGAVSGKNFANVIKKCASYDGIRKDEVIEFMHIIIFTKINNLE